MSSGNGRSSASPLTTPAHWSTVDLAGLEHRARDRGDVLEVGGGVVERGDARAAAHRFERVAAAARPEVEQAFAAREPEPVEVDRQHC